MKYTNEDFKSEYLIGIMLSEMSQTEEDKYHKISLICGMLKNTHTQAHRYREQIGGCQRREK